MANEEMASCYLTTLREVTGISSQSQSYHKVNNILKTKKSLVEAMKSRGFFTGMKEFIEYVETKSGYVTPAECWGPLLDYYEWTSQFTPKSKRIQLDILPADDQFSVMYAFILYTQQRIDKGELTIIKLDDIEVVIEKNNEKEYGK